MLTPNFNKKCTFSARSKYRFKNALPQTISRLTINATLATLLCCASEPKCTRKSKLRKSGRKRSVLCMQTLKMERDGEANSIHRKCYENRRIF